MNVQNNAVYSAPRSLGDRCRVLWAAARHAGGAAAATDLYQRAVNSGLVGELTAWGKSRGLQEHGERTVHHVIDWGVRGMNPFEGELSG